MAPSLLATIDLLRLARFTREAQVLALLNHPNIAQIYGLKESADGIRGLVMELVEGWTHGVEVLDRPAQRVVDDVHARHRHRLDLPLQTGMQTVLIHRLDVGEARPRRRS